MSHTEAFQEIARQVVVDFANDRRKPYEPVVLIDDIYVVWFSKTLKNWKTVLGNVHPGNRLYEVTYNGEHHEIYLDVYKKEENITIKGLSYISPASQPEAVLFR